MTTYKIYSIGADEGWVRAHIKVGKRDRLEPIFLTRPEAWHLAEQLLAALRATDGGGA